MRRVRTSCTGFSFQIVHFLDSRYDVVQRNPHRTSRGAAVPVRRRTFYSSPQLQSHGREGTPMISTPVQHVESAYFGGRDHDYFGGRRGYFGGR